MPKFKLTFKATKGHFVDRHGWFYGTFLFLLIYLIVFQHGFVASGDVWAEAFPEYVNDAVTNDWSEVFKSSWAGYLTIIPSFLTKLYVSVGLPLGYIDYFLRAITITFALLCLAFIAHPVNRKLIASDGTRVFIAFVLLLSLRHVSAFAFINIWYVGFMPIILISLSGSRLNNKQNAAYTIFGILVALTKSSSMLLPFVVYRAAKAKRYISSSLLSIAIIYQTYLTVFAKNGYGSSGLDAHLIDILRDVSLGMGLFVFKNLHISPANAAVVAIMSLAMVGVSIYLLIRRGFWQTSVLGVGLAAVLYLHIFAPDNSFQNVWHNFHSLYADTYKLQRELLINFFVLLLVGMFLSEITRQYKLTSRRWHIAGYVGVVVIMLQLNPLGKVDIGNPAVTADISSYRYALNHDQTVCMPVPPTQFWDYSAAWFFQYKGGCYAKVPSQPIDSKSFRQSVTVHGQSIVILTTPKDDLRTVILLVKKQRGAPEGKLALTDKSSGYTFFATIKQTNEAFAFANFNVGGLGPREKVYDFQLHTSAKSIYTGQFAGSDRPLEYAYFVGYPNIQ